MKSKFLRAIKYIRSFVALRHTDIILAAYPKSGSTWLRFLLCNVGSLLEWKIQVGQLSECGFRGHGGWVLCDCLRYSLPQVYIKL